MNKIPVRKTIAYAYSFTFGHLGTIIGLVWLPLVILTVLNFLPQMAGGELDPGSQSPLMVGSQAIGRIAIWALSLLLYSIIYVAVIRQALGLRQGTATVHFALGMPEFRVFGALLLLFVVVMAFVGTYFGVVLVVAAAGTKSMPLAIAAVAIAILGAIALLYALVRLAFLVAPVTVAEEQINLGRGWALTQGNFWRVFAVMLAVGLPMILIYLAGTMALMGNELMAPVPAAISNNAAALVQHQMQIFNRHLPESLGFELILAPFSLGLNLGAAAFAYRALVQDTAVVRAS
jgi:hypothetical protein